MRERDTLLREYTADDRIRLVLEQDPDKNLAVRNAVFAKICEPRLVAAQILRDTIPAFNRPPNESFGVVDVEAIEDACGSLAVREIDMPRRNIKRINLASDSF